MDRTPWSRIISAREIISMSLYRRFTSARRHEKCISDTKRLRLVVVDISKIDEGCLSMIIDRVKVNKFILYSTEN